MSYLVNWVLVIFRVRNIFIDDDGISEYMMNFMCEYMFNFKIF